MEVSGVPGSATYTYGNLTIWQNDKYDSFHIYKIADMAWNTKTNTYKAMAWDSVVLKWMKKNAYGTGLNGPGYAYRGYSTPAKLAAATSANTEKFYKALLNTSVDGNVITGAAEDGKYTTYGLTTLTSLGNFQYSEEDGVNTSTHSSNVEYVPSSETYVTSTNYSSLGLVAVVQYQVTTEDDLTDEYTGEVIATYETITALQNAGYSTAANQTTSIEGKTRRYSVIERVIYRKTSTTTDGEGKQVTTSTDFENGDLFYRSQGYFYISGLSYGMYAVIATNDSGLYYAPVTVTVAPDQQPPEGKWFLNNNFAITIKAGDINIDKKINNKKTDIVQIGERVSFDIVTSFPAYKDRVTLSSSSSSTSTATGVKGYTLAFDDVLSDAFSIITSSFKLYYRESEEADWKEFTNYKNLDYTAITDATYLSNPKTEITTSNIGDATYDKSVSISQNEQGQDVYTYVKTPNMKFASDSESNDGKTYYYTNLTGDAFSYIISSKAIEGDPNFAGTFEDCRGGYGLSVFACATASHKSFFQLYLFRYEDKPNLYYWYYMRNGAYYFICVDDKVTKYRSMIESYGDDGTISQEEANDYFISSRKETNEAGTTTTVYYVNTTKAVDGLKNRSEESKETYKIAELNAAGYRTGSTMQYTLSLANSSSYLKGILRAYCAITGDTVNHSINYYADWGSNMFNITFNYNALRAWMEKNEVAKISQLKVSYDCVVSSQAQIGTEYNSNQAILTYEGNANGTVMSTKEDTVYAYTYGLNVKKLAGETADSTKKTYLEGASFTLYKEMDAFVNGTWYGSMKDSPSEDLTSETTLNSYKTTHDSADYYYYEYDATEAGALDADYKIYSLENESIPENTEDDVLESKRVEVKQNKTYAKDDKIVRVFKKFTINVGKQADYIFTGSFTSTKTAAGYNVVGLDDGNYILVETLAPTGYNKLANDILFSIYPLSQEIADSVYGGSYAVFADESNGGTYSFNETSGEGTASGITDDNGYYEMTVINYKGLTLPSTGGMGTMIFTIIGVGMMMTTLLVIVAKRKKQSYE